MKTWKCFYGYGINCIFLVQDERVGSGTGKQKGRQRFVGKKNCAKFVDMETVVHKKEFDNGTEDATVITRIITKTG